MLDKEFRKRIEALVDKNTKYRILTKDLPRLTNINFLEAKHYPDVFAVKWIEEINKPLTDVIYEGENGDELILDIPFPTTSQPVMKI